MKKSGLLILFFALASRAFAQCDPDTTLLNVGFYPPDTLLPCIEEDIFFDEVLQFKNFSQVNGSVIGLPGTIITILSVSIDSVNNLPPGINYTCNTPNCFYTTGETGCVRLSGTTNAAPGIYNLGFYATLVVDFGIGPIQYPADSALLASFGLGYRLTVLNQGGDCPNRYTGQLFFNASINASFICEGDTVPLHTLTSGGTPPYSYQWTPSIYLSDPTSPDPLLYPTHPGMYSVTVTDNSGLSATDAVEVNYAQSPSISLSADTTICAGNSVQLVASGGTEYSWFPSTGLSDTDIPDPVAAPAQTTSYTVIVSQGSCAGSQSVTVNVDTATASAGFGTIKNNFNVRFTNSSSGATGFHWFFGDGTESTEENPQHQYAQNGSYEVTLIASNNCDADTVVNIVDLAVGVNDLPALHRILVYPNPGTGLFQLKTETTVTVISYEIRTVCGDVIKQETLVKPNGSLIPIDLTGQPKGVYFLSLLTGNYPSFAKVIVR